MPTYDYICTACGHQMEVVHGIHGHGPDACPVCGGVMRKGFAAPAVHFKGSGWAKKDRGAAARTKAAAKTGGDGATTSGGDDHGDAGRSGSKSGGSESGSSSDGSESGAKSGTSGDGTSTATEPKAKTPSSAAGTD